MHIHTVFFWLKDNTDTSLCAAFEHGLDLLTRDPEVLKRSIGTSALTDREVMDSTHDYGIIVYFKNTEAHDRHQTGQAHLDFLRDCQFM